MNHTNLNKPTPQPLQKLWVVAMGGAVMVLLVASITLFATKGTALGASDDDHGSVANSATNAEEAEGNASSQGDSTYSNTSSDTAAYDFAYNTSVDYRTIRENAIEFSATTAVNNMIAINDGSMFLGNVFVYNRTAKGSVVLVDKGNLTAYVASYGSDGSDGTDATEVAQMLDGIQMVDAFDILVGEATGDKMREGDRKTPEGVYYAVDYLSNKYLSRKYGSAVGNIYGTGAFPINYPNIVDKIEGRGGSGIWIHGLNPDKHKPVTLGCVAMGNERFARLMESMSVGVPTIIGENLKFTQDKDAYEQSRARYYTFLTDFTNAWSENNYDTYESMFHDDFQTPKGVRRGSFLSRKKGIMDYGLAMNNGADAAATSSSATQATTLSEIRSRSEATKGDKLIVFDNLTVFAEGDLVVYDFNQLYATPTLVSYGNKRYYVKDTPEGLRIISEEFFPRGEKEKSEVVMPYVEEFLQQWAAAWQGKDVDGYISLYAKGFRYNGMGLRQFANYKKSVFDGAGSIAVTYSDVQVAFIGNGRLRVSFVQNYASDTVADTGRKTLILTGKPDYLSIQSESWASL